MLLIWSVICTEDTPVIYIIDDGWPDVDWDEVNSHYWESYVDKKHQDKFNRKHPDLTKVRNYINKNQESLETKDNLDRHESYSRIIIAGTYF